MTAQGGSRLEMTSVWWERNRTSSKKKSRIWKEMAVERNYDCPEEGNEMIAKEDVLKSGVGAAGDGSGVVVRRFKAPKWDASGGDEEEDEEEDVAGSCSDDTKERNTQLCSEVAELRADTERVDSSAGLGDASEREGDGPGMELSDRDAASGTELRDRLRATRDRTQFMQEEYRDSRARVVEWQERCQWSENDRDWLGSELQRCHELLTSLEGDDDSSQKPWIKRIPMLAIVIAVAVATVIPRINKLMS
ncbi:uncharacterized protein LOC133355554 [Lethenteron reissneri]|uniref:uncharacterized protein LOC133355554 n=1 Tax=Lethenteron reissneri TaxID=7753 RepID=UPI002AB7A57F|nr:uncharacterized protein LOC133355554 [Lethenteron reissneri]